MCDVLRFFVLLYSLTTMGNICVDT